MPVVGRGKIDEAARVHRCNWERGRVVASCSGQQAALRALGVLDVGSLEGARRNFGSVQDRLAEMGYVEGRNLALEYRCADSHEDRLGELARDLVRHRGNAIAVFAGPSIMAAKAATTSIPIIF